MKVKEVIEQLEKLDPELDVYVYADHGQTYIKGGYCSVEHIDSEEKDDYYIESTIHEDDLIDYDGNTSLICVISD